MKFLALLVLAVLTVANSYEDLPMAVGGPQDTDVLFAKDIILRALNKVTASGGPYYWLARIYSAKSAPVAGLNADVVADLINAKGQSVRCEVYSYEGFSKDFNISIKCADGETFNMSG